MPFITLLDQHLIKKYLGTFIYTVAIFSAIIVIFDLSEKIDDLIENHATLYGTIFQYYAGFIPFYLNFLLPLINFIAVIFFTAKMANQTEIVPILSAGISFNRFLRPYAVSAFIIFAINIVFNLFIIPETNRIKIKFENTFIDPKNDEKRSNIHLKLNKNSYIYIESFDNIEKAGYGFRLEKFDHNELKEKWVAGKISYDTLKKQWSIMDYSVRYVNGLKEKMIYGTRRDTILDLKPDDFSVYENIYEAMTTKELRKNIEKEKIRGTGRIVKLQLELYKRLIFPFSSFVLTLIGVALSSRKVRGGIGLPLGIGIFISFAYIVANQFATMFALKGGIPPLISMLIPNIFFGTLGFILYRQAPK